MPGLIIKCVNSKLGKIGDLDPRREGVFVSNLEWVDLNSDLGIPLFKMP